MTHAYASGRRSIHGASDSSFQHGVNCLELRELSFDRMHVRVLQLSLSKRYGTANIMPPSFSAGQCVQKGWSKLTRCWYDYSFDNHLRNPLMIIQIKSFLRGKHLRKKIVRSIILQKIHINSRLTKSLAIDIFI